MRAGWVEAPLSEVCEISSKLVDPRDQKYQDLPHVGAGNMVSGTDEVTEVRTAREESLKSGKFLFDREMVLYSKIRPYLRKVCRPSFSGLCSADVYPLTPKAGLSRDFLFYLLHGEQFTEYAIAGSARAGMPKVNRSHLFAYKTWFPALPEQERIAAILDEAFAAIATATANAEKNLENARELFESQVDRTFARMKASCNSIKLGEIAGFRNGANFTKNSHGAEVRVVGVGDFQTRFWVPSADLGTKVLDGDLREEDQLREGDILFVRSNGNKALIGRCMLMGVVDEPIAFSGFTIRMRIDDVNVHGPFMCWYLKSNVAKRSLIDSGDGAQISNLNQGALASLVVPMPARIVQIDTAKKVDELDHGTTVLRSLASERIGALAGLKNSVLDLAFSGALTADRNALDRVLSQASV